MKDHKENMTLARQKLNELAKQYEPKLLDNNGNLLECNAQALATTLIGWRLREDLGELFRLIIKEGKVIDEMIYKALENFEYENVKPKSANIILFGPILSECLRLCKTDYEERAAVYRDMSQRLKNGEE